MVDPLRIGIVGCGAISGAYLTNSKNFANLQITACADLYPEVARAKAAQFAVPQVYTVDEMFGDPSIELILNLTVPKAHARVAMTALEAGKHVYVEKPLALSREEGKAILARAKKKGLRVGCAPDTFMGSGIQTARHVIDTGMIGRPVAFTAFMMCGGHESWHPSPEFYYEQGGGPLFDMGPYYLTALLNLLGPIRRVMGMASIAIPERTITSQPKSGKKITVETPDHTAGTIEFENGVVGSIIQSFATQFPPYGGSPIVIFGTAGTLLVPDPNWFSGAVRVRLLSEHEIPAEPPTFSYKEDDFRTVEPVFPHDYSRSVGLSDMAEAIRTGRKFRASGELALAVVDVLQGLLDSSECGKAFKPTVSFERPAPMPVEKDFGALN